MTGQSVTYFTYFDVGYLARGLALIESIRSQGDSSLIIILALDEESQCLLVAEALPNVSVVGMSEFESNCDRLLAVKSHRSRMEYIFTCGPIFMLEYVAPRAAEGSLIVYLDADLYFFDSPSLVVDALADNSIGIIEHKYPMELASRLRKYGRFNVGWVGFRKDEQGLEALKWWAESCLEWCSDLPDRGRYADQGYLDQFPERFATCKILTSEGFNLAPWNTRHTQITVRSGEAGDVRQRYLVNDLDYLVFFHFHGVRRTKSWFTTSQLNYGNSATRTLMELVYVPYLRVLEAKTRYVESKRLEKAIPVNGRGRGIRGLAFHAKRRLLDDFSKLTGNAISVKKIRL